MNLGLKGKVAAVVASSSGLGLAAAESLASEGVRLAICSRHQDRIQAAAKYLRGKYDVEIRSYACDVTDPESIRSFRAAVLGHFKCCQILFTNAGGPPSGSILDFKSPDFRNALELNLISTINLVENFLPGMKEQNWGRIIALASISVKQPLSNLALSNVSRVGVVAYIKTLSQAIAHLNITANTLAPGYFMTERVRQLMDAQARENKVSYQDTLDKLLTRIPAKRTGEPAEFGALVAFLASEQASYITGDTILIDGGMYQGLM
jgi:3-oxoacyl-[acyl-carrier protein] reductase